jgi:hypothetical protein
MPGQHFPTGEGFGRIDRTTVLAVGEFVVALLVEDEEPRALE